MAVQLTAQPRDGRGKTEARRLRREGRVPAVIYGHGDETRTLSLSAQELEKLLSSISVENTIIDLNVEEELGLGELEQAERGDLEVKAEVPPFTRAVGAGQLAITHALLGRTGVDDQRPGRRYNRRGQRSEGRDAWGWGT